MSKPMTLEVIRSATSLRVSVGGPTQLDLLDGQTTESFGRALALASRSALRESVPVSLIHGIYGRSSRSSSESEILQRSLENNLLRRLNGSSLYTVTWKAWVAPWGSYISRPRAKAPGTKGIERGYLPTPSGTSNHGKNHVAGRLDEWGGSSNPFRGTSLGKVHCPAFELWVMGYPDQWAQLMPPATLSSRKSRQK